MPKQYFNKKNALDLIEWWDIDFLVKNLWKFSGLNSEVAKQLIEKGYKSYLAWNLKYFKELDDEIAPTLINIWYWKYVKENIDSFSKFWELSYRSFEKCEDFDFIKSNFEHFDFIDVKSLWEKTSPLFWVKDLDKIRAENIDKDSEFFLIKKLRDGGNTDCLFENASKFRFYSPDDMLDLLFDWWIDILYWDLVGGIINHLNLFKNTTEETERRILKAVKEHRLWTVTKNIDKFKFIPKKELLDKILANHYWLDIDEDSMWNFIDFCSNYDKLNKTNYEKLIFDKLAVDYYEGYDKILHNIDRFTIWVDRNEILVKLLLESRYITIIKYIELFSIDKMSIFEKILSYCWNLSSDYIFEILMENIDKFNWIPEKTLVEKILKKIETMDKLKYQTEAIVWRFSASLPWFKTINIDEILQKLYDLWLWYALIRSGNILSYYNTTPSQKQFTQKLLDEYLDVYMIDDKPIILEWYAQDLLPVWRSAHDWGFVLNKNYLELLTYNIKKYIDGIESFDTLWDEERWITPFFCYKFFPERKIEETYKIFLHKWLWFRTERYDMETLLWRPRSFYQYQVDTSYMYGVLRDLWASWLFISFFEKYWVLPWLSEKSLDKLLDLLFQDWEYSTVRRIMNMKNHYISKYIKFFVDSKNYEILSRLVYNSEVERRRKIIRIIWEYDKSIINENWEDLKDEYIIEDSSDFEPLIDPYKFTNYEELKF